MGFAEKYTEFWSHSIGGSAKFYGTIGISRKGRKQSYQGLVPKV